MFDGVGSCVGVSVMLIDSVLEVDGFIDQLCAGGSEKPVGVNCQADTGWSWWWIIVGCRQVGGGVGTPGLVVGVVAGYRC